MVCEEAVMWKYLKHENVLPLLGTSVSPPQLVSPFKAAGNLSEYLKEHPGARGLRIVSVSLAKIAPAALIPVTSCPRLQRASIISTRVM